ncbi:MAG TPA: hypothetical protein VHA37_04840, partial [Candidatus Saccharimonadales bacterium]|nr:hypothetical protein [Candidatus Saccharimonadales bacterium]
MQQSAPEHLQQYQEPGTPVPPHDAAFLSQHLQETLPDHMKPYADAYVQQRTEQPTVITPTASEPTGAPPDPEAIPPTP